ncbi:MAG: hypothetical protein J7K68_03105 [Candidatus Diapherotrites archaeon]|nr:hypothetical protein [Candidatus Diapherotrites archaeon]
MTYWAVVQFIAIIVFGFFLIKLRKNLNLKAKLFFFLSVFCFFLWSICSFAYKFVVRDIAIANVIISFEFVVVSFVPVFWCLTAHYLRTERINVKEAVFYALPLYLLPIMLVLHPFSVKVTQFGFQSYIAPPYNTIWTLVEAIPAIYASYKLFQISKVVSEEKAKKLKRLLNGMILAVITGAVIAVAKQFFIMPGITIISPLIFVLYVYKIFGRD